MILKPTKSNIINLNGSIITPSVLQFAWGFGHAIGKKVKLVNIGTPFRSNIEQQQRDNLFEWFGI